MIDLMKIPVLGFNTSLEAYRKSKELSRPLSIGAFYEIARLAIGASLGINSIPDEPNDAKGNVIKGFQLFGDEKSGNLLWIGLIVQHYIDNSTDNSTVDLDKFQSLVRAHWHRGIFAIDRDFTECGEDYGKFVTLLVNRRANLTQETNTQHVDSEQSIAAAEDYSEQITKALRELKISAEVKSFINGPRLTRYNIYFSDVSNRDKLEKSLDKLGLILNIQDSSISISSGNEAKTIGLNVPRPEASWSKVPGVDIKSWVANSKGFTLPIFPGVDTLGNPFGFDLANTPHLLVAGATGMGKSVCVHSLICSILSTQDCRANVKLALIDPKQVELTAYAKLPILWGGKIAMNASEAMDMLAEIVEEMERRNKRFSEHGYTNIQDAISKGTPTPYIVVVIEELTNLLMQNSDTEEIIANIAVKGRSCGIHMIIATQRPDAKTISGQIRSNVPSRISLAVQKSSESKIILDDLGAEKLLGKGDMLIKERPGASASRVHGCYLDRSQIDDYVKRILSQEVV
ncbi:TPA: DNA translocase FtsK [Pseudomonas aeruginosa]